MLIDLTAPGIERFIHRARPPIDVRDHRQLAAARSRGSQVTFEQIVATGLSRSARSQRRLFDDLPPRGLDAPRWRTGRRRQSSKSKRREPCSMSPALFSRNADLKRLRDEGYFVQIRGGFLVMREVPYVDAQREGARPARSSPA